MKEGLTAMLQGMAGGQGGGSLFKKVANNYSHGGYPAPQEQQQSNGMAQHGVQRGPQDIQGFLENLFASLNNRP